MELQVHPAADSFPMMKDDRFNELVEDIKQNGQQEPITLYEGQILDGRNRYKACVQLGIEPLTREYEGNPWDFVWSLNGQRRDLVAEQRYLIWKHVAENSTAWRTEQARLRDEANKKRSAATKAQPRSDDGHRLAPKEPEQVDGQSDHPPDPKPKEAVSRTHAAKASKTNTGAVKRGDWLAKTRPDLAEAVRLGDIKPTEAYRQARRAEVSQKVAELPDGQYRVIYADPPWQYNDSRGQGNAGAAEDHYPTMPLSQLKELNVAELAAPDSVLLCWATFPLLPDALELVKAWGFKYKTSFVWQKSKGAGLANYHKAEAELLLVCTRGSCIPDADKKEPQIFNFPRAEHSRKPEEVRAMIDRLWKHGPRIELFRRGDKPENWDIWGGEIDEKGDTDE